MKPAPFEYFRPASLDEALALLAEHGGDAKPLAGGQSLIPAMNFRLATPAALVDLNGVGELEKELAQIRSAVEAERARFVASFHEVKDDLLQEFEAFRPADTAYSPLCFFFNFSHNVVKGTVVDALMWGDPWDVSLNDLLTSVPRAQLEEAGVVDHADLEREALEWGRKINGKSPTAQRMLKYSFNLLDDGLVGQQLFAGETTRLAYMTDEAVEGRDAFLEKRDPDWSPYPWYY